MTDLLPPLESPVQRAIVDILLAAGFAVVVHRQGGLHGKKKSGARKFVPLGAETHFPGVGKLRGYADLEVLVGRGRTIWMEVKRPELGRLSDVQAKWHKAMRALGYETHVVDDPILALNIARAAAARAA